MQNRQIRAEKLTIVYKKELSTITTTRNPNFGYPCGLTLFPSFNPFVNIVTNQSINIAHKNNKMTQELCVQECPLVRWLDKRAGVSRSKLAHEACKSVP